MLPFLCTGAAEIRWGRKCCQVLRTLVPNLRCLQHHKYPTSWANNNMLQPRRMAGCWTRFVSPACFFVGMSCSFCSCHGLLFFPPFSRYTYREVYRMHVREGIFAVAVHKIADSMFSVMHQPRMNIFSLYLDTGSGCAEFGYGFR